ncbi:MULTISPECIES: hypothetical protein [unclassified Methylobacterium]|uniref:hypothetical protein n=1 Tax=unclassified Methylobacterium TaxID=2615210 RepID=UPI000B272FC5|nr:MULTISPECIES: hypothetical protein [unclassified Methylobacterium]USU30923.1 hypothetical protein NG677_16400 [Methylobacterium sp. OTU13CASTA1]
MAASPLRPTTPTLAKYPIPVELITTLYRARGAELDALIAGMPEYARARVAAYCVERERLLDLGQRMAGTCGEATLIKAAGPKAGAALFAQSRPAPVPQSEIVAAETEAGEIASKPAVSADATPAPLLRVLEFPAVPAPVVVAGEADTAQSPAMANAARPKAA